MTLKRDLYLFHLQQLMPNYKNPIVPKSRFTLVKNLYLLHGMGIQVERSKQILKSYTDLEQESTLIIDDLANATEFSIYPNRLIERSKNIQNFTINYLAKDLAVFRHYELREYIRVTNKKFIQKFLQLYTNYYFLFISNNIQKEILKKETKRLQI